MLSFFIFLVLKLPTSKKPVQPRSFKFCSLTPKIRRKNPIDSITCDDNGSYGYSNGNKEAVYFNISGTNVSAEIVHLKTEDISTKRKRENCGYYGELKDIFEMERCYYINKTIPQLKRTICRIKNLYKPAYKPYFCVVYSLNDDADHVKDLEILLQYGNSKKNAEIQRPYI